MNVREIPLITPVPRNPALAVQGDSAGGLSLLISGANVQGRREVILYDVLGRLVERFTVEFSIQGAASVGNLSVPPHLASGTYLFVLNLPAGALSAKFIVLR